MVSNRTTSEAVNMRRRPALGASSDDIRRTEKPRRNSQGNFAAATAGRRGGTLVGVFHGIKDKAIDIKDTLIGNDS